jgi:hypothetical protein
MKSGMQTSFFLASYGFRSKVLVLVIVKKIRIRDSGSGKVILNPDPGGKKALDPGSGSTTLVVDQKLFVV